MPDRVSFLRTVRVTIVVGAALCVPQVTGAQQAVSNPVCLRSKVLIRDNPGSSGIIRDDPGMRLARGQRLTGIGRHNCGARLLIHEIPFKRRFLGVFGCQKWGGILGSVHIRGHGRRVRRALGIISGTDRTPGIGTRQVPATTRPRRGFALTASAPGRRWSVRGAGLGGRPGRAC